MSEATDVSLYPYLSPSLAMQICVANDLCLCWIRSSNRLIYWSTLWYLPFGFIYSLMPRQEAGVNNPWELGISQSTWKLWWWMSACARWSVYLSVCLSVCLLVSLSVSWSPLRCLLASDPIKSHNCCCCIRLPKLCQRWIIWTRFAAPPPRLMGLTFIWMREFW